MVTPCAEPFGFTAASFFVDVDCPHNERNDNQNPMIVYTMYMFLCCSLVIPAILINVTLMLCAITVYFLW